MKMATMQFRVLKTKDLKIPDLRGKSFLELGSKNGALCGFARFLGAERVVGIESDSKEVEQARHQFPDCDFFLQDLHQLPPEKFDVILMLDVLHNLSEQEDLIDQLVKNLTASGVLILEVKVVDSNKMNWVSGEGYNLQGCFPTSSLFLQILEKYAWKMVHVEQLDNGISSYVYHVSPRMPYLYLLMQPSGYGKSTIARKLFLPAGVKVINIDSFLNDVVLGNYKVPKLLEEKILKDFSKKRLGTTYTRIFESGLCEVFIDSVLKVSEKKDLALDGFIPQAYHKEVVEYCKKLGFVPVALYWDKPQPYPISRTVISKKIDRFLSRSDLMKASYLSLLKKKIRPKAVGHIDHIGVTTQGFLVVGWALDRSGRFPERLKVSVGKASFWVELGKPLPRPDVEDHLGLSRGDLGYSFELLSFDSKDVTELLRQSFSVRFSSGEELVLSKKLKNSMVPRD